MRIQVRGFLVSLVLAALPAMSHAQELRPAGMRSSFMAPAVAKEKKEPPRAVVVQASLELKSRSDTTEKEPLLPLLPMRNPVTTERSAYLTEDRLDVLHLWESKLRLGCFHQRLHFSPLRSAFPRTGASSLALSHESRLWTHSSTSYGLSISFHFGRSHEHHSPSRFSFFGR